MFYPQQPLCRTRPYDILKFSERAAGQNFVVAITSYQGYNMADGIVMNKNAVNRGLGRSVFFKTHETEERRYPEARGTNSKIPPATTSGYREERAYRSLGDDGIILPESEVEAKDVLVGKTSPPRFLRKFQFSELRKRRSAKTP